MWNMQGIVSMDRTSSMFKTAINKLLSFVLFFQVESKIVNYIIYYSHHNALSRDVTSNSGRGQWRQALIVYHSIENGRDVL